MRTVILLLILCSTDVKPEDVPAHVKPRYEKFLIQHVYEDMNEQKCDSVIRERDITQGQTANDCKDVNTFIQASKKTVRGVCTGAGTIYKNTKDLYVSNQPFPVVTCQLKSGERHPKCEYRGKKSTRYIVVACAEGWPTHYEEGITVTKV